MSKGREKSAAELRLERRRFARFDVRWPVEYPLFGEVAFANTENISRGGMLVGGVPIMPENEVEFSLHGAGVEPLVIAGRVCRHGDSGTHVEFLDVAGDPGPAIEQFIERNVIPGLVGNLSGTERDTRNLRLVSSWYRELGKEDLVLDVYRGAIQGATSAEPYEELAELLVTRAKRVGVHGGRELVLEARQVIGQGLRVVASPVLVRLYQESTRVEERLKAAHAQQDAERSRTADLLAELEETTRQMSAELTTQQIPVPPVVAERTTRQVPVPPGLAERTTRQVPVPPDVAQQVPVPPDSSAERPRQGPPPPPHTTQVAVPPGLVTTKQMAVPPGLAERTTNQAPVPPDLLDEAPPTDLSSIMADLGVTDELLTDLTDPSMPLGVVDPPLPPGLVVTDPSLPVAPATVEAVAAAIGADAPMERSTETAYEVPQRPRRWGALLVVVVLVVGGGVGAWLLRAGVVSWPWAGESRESAAEEALDTNTEADADADADEDELPLAHLSTTPLDDEELDNFGELEPDLVARPPDEPPPSASAKIVKKRKPKRGRRGRRGGRSITEVEEPTHVPEPVAGDRYARAKAHFKDRKMLLAIAELETLTREQPRHVEAFRMLGVAYNLVGREPNSIRAFRRFVELAPYHKHAGKIQALIADYERRNPGR